MRIDRRFSAVLLAVMALVGCPDKDAPSAQNAPAVAPPAPAPAAASAVPVPAAPPTAAPASVKAVFRAEELDQMMAPIALYPDSLLAQVLMASTYPGDVADAVAWSKANPQANGDAAVRQVAEQPWDPSVQSLVAFPAVLVTLGQDPAWVQRVGDAFLAQPDDLMDSVQRLRRQAQAAGHLESNEQQRVTVQAASGGPTTVVQTEAPSSTTTVVQAPPAEQTIIIEPADPQVVYVPSYNPSEVYGTWPNPSYPPAYYPPPPGYYFGSALVAGLGFAAGVAIVDSLWGDCDWGGGDVDIDVNHYNNINSNRKIDASQNKWQHNAANRDGVPYRDRASREQYGQRLPGSEQRDALRGREPARTADRERASQALSQRGLDAPATSNREARERAQSAEREGARQALGERGIEAPATSNREARERAQVADREMRNQPERIGQRPQASAQPRQRTQSSPQARQQARQQYSSGQGTRNNAFADARNPARSQVSASRGQTSRVSASRPQAERSSGRSVQRSVPSSSRGGARGGARGR
ncbi:DUF3300 domain-containing protein [Pseudomonas sp. MAP12]|uniref:DUF3300 domain-containing protein n=1 Tax=Geopseudomonas aromaticivorans TaxID=2849492 RepID=A0ABS6N068_9GAMM|nr:DUF3300 domain-containing protein [Pseudomonas aromaticivorans]MBV2134059.1 DUF3300 domain-containing protein [Pseudomonas aromaticivorans]